MISRLKSQVAKVLACCGLVVVFVIDIADEGTILQMCPAVDADVGANLASR